MVAGAICSLVSLRKTPRHSRVAKSLLGNGLNVVKVAPESAIRFGSFEAAKRALAHLEGHEDPTKINPYSKFMAGGFGGVTSQ